MSDAPPEGEDDIAVDPESKVKPMDTAPTQIPLSPVPTGFSISETDSPTGDKIFLLTMHTPLGNSTYFLNREGASMLAQRLLSLSSGGLELAKQMPKLSIPGQG